jgi:hypothetical protein
LHEQDQSHDKLKKEKRSHLIYDRHEKQTFICKNNEYTLKRRSSCMTNRKFTLNSTTPILRILDVAQAKTFYVDYLQFQIDWEHRFEPHFPLYMQISNGDCCLHLSEHEGDCTRGSAVRINVGGIEQLHHMLLSKQYKDANPILEKTPWNTKEITVMDPFGNRLLFFEPINQ